MCKADWLLIDTTWDQAANHVAHWLHHSGSRGNSKVICRSSEDRLNINTRVNLMTFVPCCHMQFTWTMFLLQVFSMGDWVVNFDNTVSLPESKRTWGMGQGVFILYYLFVNVCIFFTEKAMYFDTVYVDMCVDKYSLVYNTPSIGWRWDE